MLCQDKSSNVSLVHVRPGYARLGQARPVKKDRPVYSTLCKVMSG